MQPDRRGYGDDDIQVRTLERAMHVIIMSRRVN